MLFMNALNYWGVINVVFQTLKNSTRLCHCCVVKYRKSLLFLKFILSAFVMLKSLKLLKSFESVTNVWLLMYSQPFPQALFVLDNTSQVKKPFNEFQVIYFCHLHNLLLRRSYKKCIKTRSKSFLFHFPQQKGKFSFTTQSLENIFQLLYWILFMSDGEQRKKFRKAFRFLMSLEF